MYRFIACLTLCLASVLAFTATPPKGTLIIVGGGGMPQEILDVLAKFGLHT